MKLFGLLGALALGLPFLASCTSGTSDGDKKAASTEKKLPEAAPSKKRSASEGLSKRKPR